MGECLSGVLGSTNPGIVEICKVEAKLVPEVIWSAFVARARVQAHQ